VVITSDDDDNPINSILTGTSEAVLVLQLQPHMVAPPVGNNLNNSPLAPLADDADPDADDPGNLLELCNLQQSFVDMNVSQPQNLCSGSELGH
jgi:hypothetical protein